MNSKVHSHDLTMNGIFLNIVNTFFLFFSSGLMMIDLTLDTVTAGFSLFFLIVLNARKVVVEVKKWHGIAKGKEKLTDEKDEKG